MSLLSACKMFSPVKKDRWPHIVINDYCVDIIFASEVISDACERWIISGYAFVCEKNYFLSSSHENYLILPPISVRNMPDFRIFGAMQEFWILALLYRQMVWEFMILALFEYEVGRESYLPSNFSPQKTHTSTYRSSVFLWRVRKLDLLKVYP